MSVAIMMKLTCNVCKVESSYDLFFEREENDLREINRVGPLMVVASYDSINPNSEGWHTRKIGKGCVIHTCYTCVGKALDHYQDHRTQNQ